jgi:5'-nucleotidase
MNILLTNDDGIYADGLWALYQQLTKLGEVFVVAPEAERSSVGHGITLSHPIWYKKVYRKEKFFGYAINGTPADCVKFATSVLLKHKPDVLVSGINCGANDGCSVFYSGTVAGAREGSLLGIPSMAISLATFVNPDFRYAARVALRLVKRIYDEKLPKGIFLNVNVPACAASQIKGIKMAHQGEVPIHGSFHRRVDPHLRDYYWMTGRLPLREAKKDRKSDTYALSQRYVTITPLRCNLTDEAFAKVLSSWEF